MTKPNLKTIFTAVCELINKTRAAQGWKALEAEETAPIAREWLKQFEAHAITPDDYDRIFQKAVEHRTFEIKQQKQPTPFSVELLLAMHEPPRLRQCERCCHSSGLIEIEAGKWGKCDHRG